MVAVIKKLLTRSRIFFLAWCIFAAFGTYFCMYAFRKPFTSGLYESYSLFGIHFKTILIIAQVMGYMVSKWIGIKIISELKASSRHSLIIGLILFAEGALVLFGLVPAPYNLIFLFLNGLPLGMVWGVIFSYLEGRRFTEVLGIGLSISLIISSGFLKTIYFSIHEYLPGLGEFWLPAILGVLFLPAFLFFSWMLTVIPEPSEKDKQLRTVRVPMTNADKQNVIKNYGWGIAGFALIYVLLATMRDFRDNFSVEIWDEIEPGWNRNIFSQTETITGMIVLLCVGSLSLIQSNLKGFLAIQCMVAFGLSICGISTLLFSFHMIKPFSWMLMLGTGMFLAYTPIQVALFDRLIGLFRIRANAGFFVYICDACGYLGSVLLLLFKEIFLNELSWSRVLIQFSYLLVIAGILSLAFASFFFMRRAKPLDSKNEGILY